VTEHADDELDALVARADLDGLVRLVDARCATRDWAGLLRLRDRARFAVATGRQLWPAATLAEYRLALLAPAEWAATVLDEESGRFTIGPLSEVAAQQHTWSELRPHLEPTPRAAYVAHERALRGDAVDVEGLPPVLDIPAALQPWEPDYALAVYHDAGAEFPTPPVPTDLAPIALRRGAPMVDDPATELALRLLVEPWTASSNGHAEIVCVEGDAAAALGALGLHAARAVVLDAPDALAWLAWAGASGGAHGRRRGAAIGRYGMWWLLGAIGDLHDDWPPDAATVAGLLAELRFWWWDDGSPGTGWRLPLAVEDRAEQVAWAINATDAM
jgi:hypothetical protein